MQVSHAEDYNTHAILGAREKKQMRIAQSAAFFQTLSTTLYKAPVYAAIRETVCNGHDAHVMNNCVATPIQIDLNDLEVRIRDFGPGIAPEMIEPLYLTYGGSSKVEDDTQIGGFGLGCKAPFSISDHFTVTSMHGGTKTVYALSKGEQGTDGIPFATPIVAVPTTETGVEVTIPIKNNAMRFNIETYIKQIVLHGDFIATLNGKELPRWDLNSSKPLHLVPQNELTKGYSNRICVRYGHIIYPVELDQLDPTDSQTRAIEFLTNTIRVHASFGYTEYGILLEGPPNSINPTPSRESLTYNTRTKTTLKGLLDKCVEFQDAAREHVKQNTLYTTQKAITDMSADPVGAMKEMLRTGQNIYAYLPNKYKEQFFLVSKKAIQSFASKPEDIAPNIAKKTNLGDIVSKEVTKHFWGWLEKAQPDNKFWKYTTIFKEDPVMFKDALFKQATRIGLDVNQFMILSGKEGYTPFHFTNAYWYLRSIDTLLLFPRIIIGSRTSIMQKRLKGMLDDSWAEHTELPIYIHEEGKGEETKVLMEKLGFMAVFDFDAAYQEWLDKQKERRKSYTPITRPEKAKSKVEGLIPFSEFTELNNKFHTSTARITDYTSVMTVYSNSPSYTRPFYFGNAGIIPKSLRDSVIPKVGIAKSITQYQAILNKGIPSTLSILVKGMYRFIMEPENIEAFSALATQRSAAVDFWEEGSPRLRSGILKEFFPYHPLLQSTALDEVSAYRDFCINLHLSRQSSSTLTDIDRVLIKEAHDYLDSIESHDEIDRINKVFRKRRFQPDSAIYLEKLITTYNALDSIENLEVDPTYRNGLQKEKFLLELLVQHHFLKNQTKDSEE